MKKITSIAMAALFAASSHCFAQDAEGHFFINIPVAQQVAGNPLTQCLKYLPQLKAGTIFKEVYTETDSVGAKHIYANQYIVESNDTIQEDGKAIRLHVMNDLLFAISGQLSFQQEQKDSTVTTRVKSKRLSPEAALKKAGIKANAKNAKRVYIDVDGVSTAAYRVKDGSDNVFIDAMTGKVLKRQTMMYNYKEDEGTSVKSNAELYRYGTKEMNTVKMADSVFVLHDNDRKIYTYNASYECLDAENLMKTGEEDQDLIRRLYLSCPDFTSKTQDWMGHTFDYSCLGIGTTAPVGTDALALKTYCVTPDDEMVKKEDFDMSSPWDNFYLLEYTTPRKLPVDTSFVSSIMYMKDGKVQSYNLVAMQPAAVKMTQTNSTATTIQYNVLNDFQPALDIHWGMQQVMDYYKEVYKRDSYNNKGSVVRQYFNPSVDVAYGSGMPTNACAYTAYSDEQGIMLYGSGYPIFYPVTNIDVMGHEFTHLIAKDLLYERESGALNEAFADICGKNIQKYVTGEESWIIADGLYVKTGKGLRDMADPHSFDKPAQYWDEYYYDTTQEPTGDNDYCGVHTNSNVVNHWYYLLCKGGEYQDSLGETHNVKPICRERAGRIAFYTLVGYQYPHMIFHAARKASICEASVLYGADSQEVQSVKAAWDAVKVYAEADETPTAIKGISAARTTATNDNGRMYNTAGIPVNDSYQGIVIANGKKMVK